MSKLDFWEYRAKNGTLYKGEFFYTISPLPFYIKRRKVLLDLLRPYVSKATEILDFGCGDGWYTIYFKNLFRNKKFTGLDISNEFITKAQLKNKEIRFYQSSHGINQYENYDLIYSNAVFAHINDENLDKILKNIYDSLTENGTFIIFEQVGAYSYKGEQFTRRTISEYKDILTKIGFEIKQINHLNFKYHRIFERYVAKHFYKLYDKQINSESRLLANKNPIFRFISSLFLVLDRNVLEIDPKENKWGNSMIILTK